MTFLRIILGAMLVLCPALGFAAQSGTSIAKPAEISFELERPGLPVPHFVIRVSEDGAGTYHAEEVQGPADDGTLHYASGKHVDQTLNLTPAMVAKIFKAARELRHFDIPCASKAKNIANTGKKTLSYTGADGAGSCVYNYSENKTVQMLTDSFLGIANTLDEGRRLEYLHRYDRLGLDAEIIALKHSAEAGHSLELGTIAPVLTSIANDSAVMERVRLMATKLLEQTKGDRI